MIIHHSKPTVLQEGIDAVTRVLGSGMVAQGPEVQNFEAAVSSYLGLKGGVAVTSGTTALHLALLSLNVQAGDEIILPSYLCVAPLNAIYYTGATPVLADVDPETGNIDFHNTKALITPKTKAIIVPHMLGCPAPIDKFVALGVPVVEDLAQAIGARYKGKPVGSFGDVAICSFYATKVISAGEGGMVLSNNDEILACAKDMRDYDEKTPYKPRYNYKMTEMQAALGSSQIGKLDEFIAARKAIAQVYDTAFAGLPVQLPMRSKEIDAIYYRYILQLDTDSDTFMQGMAKRGIICRHPVYKPLHKIIKIEGFPGTDLIHKKAVSLPIYPGLASQEMDAVVAGVHKLLKE